MDIYLQSRGQKGAQDYRWLKIYENSKWLKNVQLLDPPILEISQFYQSDTPAVVLYRNNQKLILFIYWLKTKQRSLDYGRPVQNSLVLIGEENDCLLFQLLASEALDNWQSFAAKFDNCVQWGDDEYGFQVEQSLCTEYIINKDSVKDYKQLKDPDQKIKLACDVLNVNSKSPEKQKIFQKTKQNWIKKLAKELAETKLPSWDGPLVVVAENVAEEVLKLVVWWGISDRVEHNNESGDWKEIEVESGRWKEIEIVKEEVKKKSPTPYIILASCLVCLVTLAVMLSFSHPQNNPNPQPSLPTQIQLSPTPQISPEAKIQSSPKPQMTPEAEIQPSPNPQIEVLPSFQVNIYLRYTHL